jgi:hypothetical protein
MVFKKKAVQSRSRGKNAKTRNAQRFRLAELGFKKLDNQTLDIQVISHRMKRIRARHARKAPRNSKDQNSKKTKTN